ncbi:MAG: hypothetical protein AABZ39_14030 [Spirochaetota bacterium]
MAYLLFVIALAASLHLGCARTTASTGDIEKRIIVLYQERLTQECRVSETQMTNIRSSIERVIAANPVTYADINAKEKALRAALARSPSDPAAVETALAGYKKVRERYRLRGEEFNRAVEEELTAEQKARFVLFQKDFFRHLRSVAAKAKKQRTTAASDEP